jgi:hypothetical protein
MSSGGSFSVFARHLARLGLGVPWRHHHINEAGLAGVVGGEGAANHQAATAPLANHPPISYMIRQKAQQLPCDFSMGA